MANKIRSSRGLVGSVLAYRRGQISNQNTRSISSISSQQISGKNSENK